MRCRSCKKCNENCADYREELCTRLSRPPYVCNGCSEENRCTLRKKYYIYRTAQKEYKQLLSEARSGINVSETELKKMDGYLSPLIKNGQSVHHIMASHPDQFSYCEKSIYTYVRSKLLGVQFWDMPRMARMKPRRNKSIEHKVDKNCRIGRTYADYQQFLRNNPDTAVVEMDSVIGSIGGKVLLTILFTNCSLMLAFLRDRNTSQSVIDVFDGLFDMLGEETFKKLFPVLLGDNGSEFSNPAALETAPDGSGRTRVFYCDPGAAYQKARVEVNHEFIRRVVPKGSSFDDLSQAEIDLMMSHINSYKRRKLNDRSPVVSFSFLYGSDILDLLNVKLIAPNDIVLRPDLLKK